MTSANTLDQSIKKILVQSPSNIALVKYMGKSNTDLNLPANSSLSMTLSDLCSFVELVAGSKGISEPTLKSSGLNFIRELPGIPKIFLNRRPDLVCAVPDLSPKGLVKLEKFYELAQTEIARIFKQELILYQSIEGLVNMRSCNTFPEASGIASSASSFSAFTLAIASLMAVDTQGFELEFKKSKELRFKLAQVSRRGSGSSCRSFFGPWVSWTKETVNQVQVGPGEWVDLVLQVGAGKKEVSSSEAHTQTLTSPLWSGRVERANGRFESLKKLLGNFQSTPDTVNKISDLVRDEFLEMHSMFHTSAEPFTYWKAQSVLLVSLFLKMDQKIWEESPSGCKPVLTMDAGPHLHWLCIKQDLEYWENYIRSSCPQVLILKDQMGDGPTFYQDHLTFDKYEREYFAKVVLSGEHSVLRGASAVVIPSFEYKLTLIESDQGKPVSKLINSELLLKMKSFDEYFSNSSEFENRLQKKIELRSTIPSGAGLGSSAAYCLAFVDFIFLNLSPTRRLELARQCEDVFHKKSSGMDTAAVSTQAPIHFDLHGFKSIKGPNLGLVLKRFKTIDSLERAKTKKAIETVEKFRFENPKRASELDLIMSEASSMMAHHLQEMCTGSNESAHVGSIVTAMNQARTCFEEWGLVTSSMKEKMNLLLAQGALAVKPTGSGLGGFLVAFY